MVWVKRVRIAKLLALSVTVRPPLLVFCRLDQGIGLMASGYAHVKARIQTHEGRTRENTIILAKFLWGDSDRKPRVDRSLVVGDCNFSTGNVGITWRFTECVICVRIKLVVTRCLAISALANLELKDPRPAGQDPIGEPPDSVWFWAEFEDLFL